MRRFAIRLRQKISKNSITIFCKQKYITVELPYFLEGGIGGLEGPFLPLKCSLWTTSVVRMPSICPSILDFRPREIRASNFLSISLKKKAHAAYRKRSTGKNLAGPRRRRELEVWAFR